ncbi:MAG: Methionine synthase [Firmicutes bacterium]|nr:Methionine synthase [Bacillota bacterium]
MIKIFDGGLGTMLQAAGLPPGYCPELWTLENPEALAEIHRQYVLAGANIITTNTFGANRIKLSHYNLQDKVALLNASAVKTARSACGPNTQVAGSVGPTGKFIAPLGDQSFETTFDVYYEQAQCLDACGVDMIIIETIIDIQEMRAALLAAKAATTKPIICQFSFGADGRTVTGTDPVTAAITLSSLGAHVIGANCSLGPEQLLEVVSKIAQTTNLPVSIQPNAGMPRLENGRTIFPMTPEQMAEWAPKLVEAGAAYIGACCGSTPAHIKAVRDTLQNCGYLTNPPFRTQLTIPTALTSRTNTVYLGANFPTVVIGERINPTGRKALAADLRAKDFTSIKKEALAQIQAGAQILDVNMGVPGIDQADTMKQAVETLSMLVAAPLSIDTTDPSALEAGLRYYPGRALINSLTAEPKRLEQFLPLAKKYGAAIICLPVTGAGLPSTPAEKIEAVQTIIDAARQTGLNDADFVLDALVLTLAANPDAGKGILETLRLYREHFGFFILLHVSGSRLGCADFKSL